MWVQLLTAMKCGLFVLLGEKKKGFILDIPSLATNFFKKKEKLSGRCQNNCTIFGAEDFFSLSLFHCVFVLNAFDCEG